MLKSPFARISQKPLKNKKQMIFFPGRKNGKSGKSENSRPGPAMKMPDNPFLNFFRGCCPHENVSKEDDCLKILQKKSFFWPGKFMLFFNQMVFSDKIADEYAKPILKGIISRLFYEAGFLPSTHENPGCLSPALKKEIIKFVFHCLGTYEFIKSDCLLVAEGVKALSLLAGDFQDMEFLVFIQTGLAGNIDPEPRYEMAGDLYDISQKSVRGKAAESVILLAINFYKNSMEIPQLTRHLLLRFATDPHPGVRVSVLLHLESLAKYMPGYSWRLFDCAFQNFFAALRPYGEAFAASQLVKEPEKAIRFLEKAKKARASINPGIWAGPMSLAFLSGALPERKWLKAAGLFMDDDLWAGLFDNFVKNLSVPGQKKSATGAIILLMEKFGLTPKRLENTKAFFDPDLPDFVDIKIRIAYNLISVLSETDGEFDILWFFKWLSGLGKKAPGFCLQICEALITQMETGPRRKIWHKKEYAEKFAIICHYIEKFKRGGK